MRERFGPWRLGCLACKQGPFGRDEVSVGRIADLLAHQAGLRHRQAVAKMLGLSGPMTLRLAPSLAQFRAVYEHRRASKSNQHGVATVGKRKKIEKMQWFIAEARRIRMRRFLRRATCVVLHQDASGSRLILRFAASTAKYELMQDAFGISRYHQHGSQASGIAKGTKELVKTFCVPYHGAPHLSEKQANRLGRLRVLDAALEARIRNSVEIADTDAAPDEVAAGKLLRCPVAEGEEAYFPNAKFSKTDITHGVGRPGVSTAACPRFPAACPRRVLCHNSAKLNSTPSCLTTLLNCQPPRSSQGGVPALAGRRVPARDAREDCLREE